MYHNKPLEWANYILSAFLDIHQKQNSTILSGVIMILS